MSLNEYDVWFVTGSQHLYGDDTLRKVAEHSPKIAERLNKSTNIAVNIIWKPTVTTPDEIYGMAREANASDNCIGLICWMHTFSPAKMWISGLNILNKPFMHLHTQYNRDLPWDKIDMDFMNLNQSAHGGREFGFIGTRMGIERKVVVGFWQDKKVQKQIDNWCRAAAGKAEAMNLKVARFGDNMREVAVTEGNKVTAQMQFGFSVNGFGLGDLKAYVDQVTDAEIDKLVEVYKSEYKLKCDSGDSLRESAGIEIGMRAFLEQGGYKAFTTTFEDLHGLDQLPGLACQRLMADGYGFGAEGDWKTAAMTRIMKVMAEGLKGGTSFMEDYTYDLSPQCPKVLGSHMLEVCPSIADKKPTLEVHPLGIGGKNDPARLVFNSPAGSALNASLIELNGRFRLIVNEVKAVKPEEKLPMLPVARTVWIPQPNLEVGAAAWILAGGAHHTVYSQAISTEVLEDFAEMTGIELIVIDKKTNLRNLKDQLRWNNLYYTVTNKY